MLAVVVRQGVDGWPTPVVEVVGVDQRRLAERAQQSAGVIVDLAAQAANSTGRRGSWSICLSRDAWRDTKK